MTSDSDLPDRKRQKTDSGSSTHINVDEQDDIVDVDMSFNGILAKHFQGGERFHFVVEIGHGHPKKVYMIRPKPEYIRPIPAVEDVYDYPLAPGEMFFLNLAPPNEMKLATLRYITRHEYEQKHALGKLKREVAAFYGGASGSGSNPVRVDAQISAAAANFSVFSQNSALIAPNSSRLDHKPTTSGNREPVESAESSKTNAGSADSASRESSGTSPEPLVGNLEQGPVSLTVGKQIEQFQFPYEIGGAGRMLLSPNYPGIYIASDKLSEIKAKFRDVTDYIPALLINTLNLGDRKTVLAIRRRMDSNGKGITNITSKKFLDAVKAHVQARFPYGNGKSGIPPTRVTGLINNCVDRFTRKD